MLEQIGYFCYKTTVVYLLFASIWSISLFTLVRINLIKLRYTHIIPLHISYGAIIVILWQIYAHLYLIVVYSHRYLIRQISKIVVATES